MAQNLAGVAPSFHGFNGRLFGKPIYANADILRTQAQAVDGVARELTGAATQLDQVIGVVSRLPRELPLPFDGLRADLLQVIGTVNVVAGQLSHEADAIRAFWSTMARVDLENMSLFSPFALAVATGGGYGERGDDIIDESTSVTVLKVSIGPQAKLKIPKINVGVGAAATIDVVIIEHVTYFRDGTVEVTFSTGGGLGGEVLGGPKPKVGTPDAWGAGMDARFGASGATTYRVNVDELDELRVWISDGYNLNKLTRGDHPGVVVSTTTEVSIAEGLHASLNNGGQHAVAGNVEGVAAETTIKHDGGGLKRGDVVASIVLSASSSRALQKELGLPMASATGSIAYSLTIVRDKHGNLKAIEISESVTGDVSGTKEFGDSSKKGGSIGAGAAGQVTTSHRIDVHDNPAVSLAVSEAYLVAIYKGGGSIIAGLAGLDTFVRTHGVKTADVVSVQAHVGGSGGAHFGVGIEASHEITGSQVVSHGTVTGPTER